MQRRRKKASPLKNNSRLVETSAKKLRLETVIGVVSVIVVVDANVGAVVVGVVVVVVVVDAIVGANI